MEDRVNRNRSADSLPAPGPGVSTRNNALIPVVTLIGLQLPIVVGGAVIIENIFNLPGLGQLMVIALTERDYPVVSGINLFFAVTVLAVNLMIDLLYPYLDPRVRYR